MLLECSPVSALVVYINHHAGALTAEASKAMWYLKPTLALHVTSQILMPTNTMRSLTGIISQTHHIVTLHKASSGPSSPSSPVLETKTPNPNPKPYILNTHHIVPQHEASSGPLLPIQPKYQNPQPSTLTPSP
jgi:hypothetical protein